MTKTEIGEARTNLVRTIIAIKKLKTQKTALAKALEPDCEAHEAEYRNGVKTDAGVLVRKPKWNFDAKPVVEVAGRKRYSPSPRLPSRFLRSRAAISARPSSRGRT